MSRAVLALAVLVVWAWSVAARAQPSSSYAWVEYVAGGLEIRSVTHADHCPVASLDGAAAAMRLRAAPDPAFPVAICELEAPAGTRLASVDGVAVPLPPAAPRRILIFGDTGCRLKGAVVQDCNDARAWPFAAVVRRAAEHKPDLVIHVGDYYYRETACPAGHKGCEGSPFGDTWASWEAEFFAPAAPLLATSAWVMVRGNHESCSRGGGGWFRLLDAASPAPACPGASAPFKVNLGGLNLYLLDSADTDDQHAPADKVAAFSGQMDGLRDDLAQGTGWILTHRPIWGLAPVGGLGPFGPIEAPLNATEQAAVRGHDLGGVQMIVSGHIHHFASFSFGPARPAQLVVGTGGDIGDDGDSRALRSHTARVDGMDAENLSFERYGYLLLERDGSDWSGAFRDLDDKIVARCRLHARALTCARPPPG